MKGSCAGRSPHPWRTSRRDSRREAEQEEDDAEVEWISSFCGCLADPSSCLLTTACPCIAAGLVAQKVEKGATHWVTGALIWLVLQGTACVGCLASCKYRKRLRARYNLRAVPFPDSLVHLLCWPCAICQELRELKARETAYYGFGDDDKISFVPPPEQIMWRSSGI